MLLLQRNPEQGRSILGAEKVNKLMVYEAFNVLTLGFLCILNYGRLLTFVV